MGSGHFTTDFFGYSDEALSIAIQADGKFYVSGTSSGYFALARYNSHGILDAGFNGDGKVVTDLNLNSIIDKAQGRSVAIQSDGKVLVAGQSGSSTYGYKFALARFNSDGSLDTTFDGDGRVLTSFSSSSYGRSVAVQADGKILVAGTTVSQFALARYNSDGSLDTTFGASGKVLTTVGTSFGGGECVTIQADGKILVSGDGDGSKFTLVRYNTNGSLDVTFGGDGKVITEFQSQSDGGRSVTIQPDGKIVVTGTTGNYPHRDFALVRYNSDGSLDTSFDGDGKVITDFGAGEQGQSVRIQSDGKILVAGDTGSYPNFSFALARYNTNGSLDATFDLDGKVVTDFGFGASASALSVGLQADGRVVLVGYSGGDFALARYNADGSLDTSFGTTPVADTTAPTAITFSPADEATGVAVASNIVVTFSEAIARGTGNIVLKTTAGATVATYDAATSANLILSGSTLTLNPSADLSAGASYKVEFAPGSIKDLAGNSFAGTTSYNFTTVSEPINQIFTGTSANESFSGGTGNDIIDGAGGLDTANYSGSRMNFLLNKTVTGFSIADRIGTEGSDTLTNIERLQFADKKIAIDLSPSEHGGQALEFIGLLAPDLISSPSVVGLILNLFDQGSSLHDVCQLALDVGLVNSIAGSNTNEALAAMAFRNLIGSEADANTIQELVGYIDGRYASYSQADFMTVVAGLELNQTHIGLVGLQQTGVEYV